MCINNIENHNSNVLASRFDDSDKGSYYGQWGAWLMSLKGECVMVVDADGIWKRTMEGDWGIPLSFSFQNRTESISFSIISRT